MNVVPFSVDYIKVGASSCELELKELAKSESKQIRRRVAENNNCPKSVLKSLSLDNDCDVRIAVAEHMRTPKATLMLLCNDPNPDVRYAIASTPARYSGEVLSKLLSDENPYIVDRAQKSIAALNLLAVV